jgi:hypothetical protein
MFERLKPDANRGLSIRTTLQPRSVTNADDWIVGCDLATVCYIELLAVLRNRRHHDLLFTVETTEYDFRG